MLSSVGRIVLLGVLLVAAALLALALVTAFHQVPPPAERHYVGLSWKELKDSGRRARLFSVTPNAAGLSVTSGAWKCSKSALADGDEVTCGDRRFQYERSTTADRLIAQGFLLRKGTRQSFGSGEDADVLVRGPGVGVRHAAVWVLPSTDAPCDPGARSGLCIENGGASGSLVVYTDGGRRSKQARHGESVRAGDGDELWLGYVPLYITRDHDDFVLQVPLGANATEWTELRGDRAWQRLEMPAWTLGRTSTLRHDFYPEAALDRMRAGGGEGDLIATRVEVQQEETVQKLVDYELLCLDRDKTANGSVPRLRWRDPSNPGCEGADLQHDLRLAVPPDVERMFRAARVDRSINRFVEIAAKRLEKNEFVDDPSELPLIFDYRFTDAGEELRQTPVTLLGVRPQVSFHRAKRQPAVDPAEPDIRFAAESDSPRLEVTAVGPSLASGAVNAGMQLILAPGGRTVQHAWLGVGGQAPANARPWLVPTCGPRHGLDCGPAVIVLGSVWFGPGRFAWLPAALAAAPANGTSALFTIERKGEGMKTVLSPHGAPILVNGETVGGEVILHSGDTLVVDALTLTYESGDGLAATTRRAGGGFHRTYPAGRDALQLIGFGSRTGGIEASLQPQTATLARERWKKTKAPIGLTVRADLQHIVARELNAAVNRLINETVAKGGAARAGRITGSAVLMNSAGDVLAVGNAPTANMGDPETMEQTLLDEERRHSEGRQLADQKLLNHAFLRALPVGSTQKIATSLALFRENHWPRNDSDASCLKHLHGYWIRSGPRVAVPALESLGKYDCNGNHAGVLPVGSLASWRSSFRESCDVYFGLAALGLVPGYSWIMEAPSAPQVSPGLSQMDGETRVVFGKEDPSLALRPGSLQQPVPGDGDAYLETLLLLGFRFGSSFEGKGVNAQTAKVYDGITYPTTDLPWLPGLAPRAGFVYPTVAGPDGYTNAYATGGIQKVTPRPNVVIDGRPYNVKREHQWVEYMMTGWGQNMTGNALSIATSALPTVDESALMPQPHIIASPIAPIASSTRPPILGQETLKESRGALRAALREVVLNGTAKTFFKSSSVKAMVGGKTGTIQIEMGEPRYTGASDRGSARRVLRHSCGVLDSGATQNDWNVILAEAGKRFKRDSGWPLLLPPFAFAEGGAVCTAPFNPGLPRSVEGVAGAPAQAEWERFITLEFSAQDREKVVSSAFVAVTLEPLVEAPAAGAKAVPPLQARDAAGEGWVLAVIVDDRAPSPATPTTAKEVSVAILESLQRYMEVRNQ